jgi:Flp pilus assembly pilin Flp
MALNEGLFSLAARLLYGLIVGIVGLGICSWLSTLSKSH